MIKKFTFKDLHKDFKCMKLKYFNQIIWYNDIENHKKVTIKDFLNNIKMDCKDNKTLLDSINNKYSSYKILGTCEINKYLQSSILLDQKEYMYLISDDLYKILYLSIGKCHPIYWYEFSSKNSFINGFDKKYDTYNQKIYNYNLEKNCCGYIGNQETLPLSIYDLENHFLLNKNCEKLIWGSLWMDHPFRDKYMEKTLTYQENITLTGQAMRQEEDDTYSVSVRTMFSKSLITLVLFENELLINIEYTPISINTHTSQIKYINEHFKTNFKHDLPIDVVSVLQNIPFITPLELLKIRPLVEDHFFILTILTNTYFNDPIFDQVGLELEKIPFDDTINDDLKEHVENFIKEIKNNNILKKILKKVNFEQINEKIMEKCDEKFKDVCDEDDYGDDYDEIFGEILNEKVKKIMLKYDCDGNEFIKECLTNFINEKFDN